MNKILLCVLVICLHGCVALPEGLSVVEDFQAERYLGRWYEIARLDHSFERGLSQVTANYRRREDGGILVINRGYDDKKQSWRQAEGKAYFLGSPTTGSLKVSFFGPFYGGYHILALDKEDYRYSLVAGPNQSYLWILSRTPTLDKTIQERLITQARNLGFNTDKLIFVRHSQQETDQHENPT